MKTPAYLKGTYEGKLYIDKTHPEWIAYFTKFITDNHERLSKLVRK